MSSISPQVTTFTNSFHIPLKGKSLIFSSLKVCDSFFMGCFTSSLSKSDLLTKNCSNIGCKVSVFGDSKCETSCADRRWETAAWDRGCFKRTPTASWVRSDIQQKHLEKFSWTGSVNVKWSQIFQGFPASNMLNDWLITHNFIPVQQTFYCKRDTWRRFSSNQRRASLQLVVQGLLVSSLSFREHRLCSTKIRVLPFRISAFEQSCTIHKGPGQRPWAQSHALIPGLP